MDDYCIQYSTDWPLSVSLSNPGPVIGVIDVIENIDPVNITCLADCNPDCGYVWTDANGTVVSADALLSFVTVTRYDSGEYKCTAKNMYGEIDTSFTLNVLCKFIHSWQYLKI